MIANPTTIDESKVIDTFYKNNVLTINELKLLLPFSVRTIYNRLKTWKAINSYNKNGKFYTLPDLAKFDSYGLWHYNDIHFSVHGNLKQTLVHIVRTSEDGLNAHEISGVLKMDYRSFLWQFSKLKQIRRVKINGAYVWFSSDKDTFQQQETTRLGVSIKKTAIEIKDPIAILLLVERIKNPEMGLKGLSELLYKQGVSIDPSTISSFFSYHGIEKKNNFPDSGNAPPIDQ